MNQTQQNQKLYVGNLNFDATEDQVRELFGTYGDVQEVKIVMDRFSGRSRGFGFVMMGSVEGAEKAKTALQGQPFQGKTLIIDWARAEQQRGDRPASGERRSPRPGGGEFRPRREGGGGGWGSPRGGERRDFRSERHEGGGYHR